MFFVSVPIFIGLNFSYSLLLADQADPNKDAKVRFQRYPEVLSKCCRSQEISLNDNLQKTLDECLSEFQTIGVE